MTVVSTQQLPEPGSLQFSQGQWVQLLGPVSTPTADRGDWSIWPHMQGKEHWIKFMGARAGLVANFLEARNIGMDGCMICSEFGRGTQSNFEGHVGGLWHFKHWCRLCSKEEAKDMSVYREKWWEEWQVSGGAMRFNHADGEIQMCRGSPPPKMGVSTPALCAPQMGPQGVQGLSQPSAGPVPPGSVVDVMAFAKQRPREIFSLCAEGQHLYFEEIGTECSAATGNGNFKENQFYILCAHIGHPTTPKGDLNSCHWLSTKNTWKPAMRASVDIVEKLLHAFQVWPECMLCPNGVGFADHIPAEKHLRALWEKLPAGVPVVECAKSLWQEWTLPLGIIKINHVHGQVWICRGRNPPPNQRAKVIEALGVPPQPQVPQAGPQPTPPHVGQGFPSQGQFSAAPPSDVSFGPAGSNFGSAGFPVPGAQSEASYSFAGSFGRPPVFSQGPLPAPGPGPAGPAGPACPAPAVPPVAATPAMGVESPQQLPQEGIWYTIQPPCSEPTRARGDYSAYPHLGGKAQFKHAMTPRAGAYVRILASQPAPIDPQCTLCERHRGYEEHLGAEKHWKALYTGNFTAEAVVIEDVKDRLWNTTKIPGGYVRLNELTGELQMAKGIQEPIMVSAGLPAVAPPAPAPAPVPNTGWGPPPMQGPPMPGPPMPGPPMPPMSNQAMPSMPNLGYSNPLPTPTWNDNMSTAGCTGRRADLESSDGRTNRAPSVASSTSNEVMLQLLHRNVQKNAQHLQRHLLNYTKPEEFNCLCNVCNTHVRLHEVAVHFGGLEHVQQMMNHLNMEPDKEQFMTCGRKTIRVAHADLSIIEAPSAQDGSTGGQADV